MKELILGEDILDDIDRKCRWPDHNLTADEVIFDEEVVFEDGCRMALRVVASDCPNQYPCWTEAILFDDKGIELACSPIDDTLRGKWTIYFEDKEYSVNVV